MKKTGYKEMLRDRCPAAVNYALKWQKAKTRWIEHAYARFINIYSVGSERYNATRIVLGIKKGKSMYFDFDKSIDWDNLSDEEKVYWERISSWVGWFRRNYASIENAYDISRKIGRSEFDTKVVIINRYLSSLLPKDTDSEEVKQAKYKYVDRFVNFLIKCFNGSI